MKIWTICSNGNVHEFYSWKDAASVWDVVKATNPGDAILRRGPKIIDQA